MQSQLAQHRWRHSLHFLSIAFFLSSSWCLPSFAVQALDGAFAVKQPDGTVLELRKGGDEHFNWVTYRGKIVQRDPSGFWSFMSLSNGKAALTLARAGIDSEPSAAATTRDISALRTSARQVALQETAGLPSPASLGANPTLPTERLLVVLVSFADRAILTTPGNWANAFFGTSGKTVRTYYDQVSRSAFHFAAANESSGTANDGVVTVTLTNNHPNTGDTIDSRNLSIVSNALTAADSVVNFAQFDSNSDGKLSQNELHVVTVIAGFERSAGFSTPSVWGHRSFLGQIGVNAPLLDGVTVCSGSAGGGYTQVGEYHNSHMATIGILCHELGHDIGLPDLYDIDDSNGSSEGVGGHCLMGSGSWGNESGEDAGATPTLMCGWARLQMGFLTPTVIGSPGTYAAKSASDSANANLFKLATPNAAEYFLIENRQLTGFDAGLWRYFNGTSGGASGGGLAVWHVDETRTGNGDENRKLVDLEEANELAVGHSELDNSDNRGNRQQYFYSGHVTAFTDATTPNTRLYNGSASGLVVSNIAAAASSMTFQIAATASGGNHAPVLSNPRVTPVSGNTGTTFEYLIDYYDADGDAPDPSYRTLYISSAGGTRTETMTLKSGTAANGTYRYASTLAVGTYSYRFFFADGHGGFDAEGWFSGPTVYSSGQSLVNVVIQCTRISSDLRLQYSLASASGPWTDLPITKAILDPLPVPAGATVWFQASVASANYEYREWELKWNGQLQGNGTGSIWWFTMQPTWNEVGLNVFYRYTPQQYSISGTVLTGAGTPVLGGVDLMLTSSEQTVSNHVASSYTFNNVQGGVSVSITPSADGYQFSPANLVFPSLAETKSGQNFTAYSSDDYAPVTTIHTAPPAVATAADASFTWSGTDDVTPGGNLQYQWKLDGKDADWSAWAGSTSAVYSLPNGAYIFWVRGKDDPAGNISQAPASHSFVVNAAPLVQSASRINRSVWASRVTLTMPPGTTHPTNSFVLLPEHSAMTDTELVPVRIHRADEQSPCGANEIAATDFGLPALMTKTNGGWIVALPDAMSPGETSQYDIVWGKIAAFGWQDYVPVPLGFPNVGQDYPLEADSSGIMAFRLDDNYALWRLARKYRNATGNVGDARAWCFLNATAASGPVLNETILQHEVGHPFDGSIGYGFDFIQGTILKRSDSLATFWFDHKQIYDGVHDYSHRRFHTQVCAEDGSFISDEHGTYEARYGLTFPEETIDGRLWLSGSTDGATEDDPAYLWYQVLDSEGQTLIPKTDIESLQKPDGWPFYADYRARPIGSGVLLIFARHWDTTAGRYREQVCYQVRDSAGSITKATTIVTPVLDDSVSKNDRYSFETVLPDKEGKVWVSYFHSQSGQPTTYHYFILDSAGDMWKGPTEVPANRHFQFCDQDGFIWATEAGNLILLNPDDSVAMPARPSPWVPGQAVGAIAASVDANGYRLYDRWSPATMNVEVTPGAPHAMMELVSLDLWGNDLNPTNVLLKKGVVELWSQPGTFTGRVSVAVGTVLEEGHNTVTMTQSSFLGGQVLLTFPYVIQHTISSSAGANGHVEPQGMVTVSNGANQVFAITPDSYFHVANVMLDDNSAGPKTSHTFTNVTADHSLLATFAPDMATNSTPVWWLAQKGLTNGTWDAEALGDQDHDGLLTWEEYQVDTHPKNAQSVLRFLGLTTSNGQALIEWQGGQSVRQYLESRTTLAGTGTQWQCIFTNEPITAVTNSMTWPTPASNLFFRIKAGR